MTREAKVEWLRQASDIEVLGQFKRAALTLTSSRIAEAIEAQEDYELAEDEILRRMAK